LGNRHTCIRPPWRHAGAVPWSSRTVRQEAARRVPGWAGNNLAFAVYCFIEMRHE